MTSVPVKILGSITFAAGCLAILGWLYTMAGGQLPLTDKHPYGVQAVVPSAVQIAKDADVREAGVKVGRVTAISNRAGTAVLGLALDADHAPVYRDARVRVRAKTLLGENYVELDPGTPKAGRVPEGGALPLANAMAMTQIDEILSTFDASTRRLLQRLLGGLGGGLRGRGGSDLNRLVASTSGLVTRSAPALEVLGRERGDVAAIVDDLGRVMRALGGRSEAIRLLSRRLRVQSTAIAARDRQLAATIDALPSTLRQARLTTTRLGAFSSRRTPVLADLAVAVERLVPAVDALDPAARSTQAMLDQLRRFNRVGTPLLAALRRFSDASVPVVPPLAEALRELTPLLRYLGPYAKDMGAFFANQASITSAKQGPGNIGRIHATISSSTATSYPPELQAALEALTRAGAFKIGSSKGNNAYPAPGEMAHPNRFSGKYPRIEADRPAP